MIAVMPRVYIFSGIPKRWCNLKEVCELVPELARISGVEFSPTPEDLVSQFAALIRPNHRRSEKDTEQKKIFRYILPTSVGFSFMGKEVPTQNPAPPHALFQFDIETPYPDELYVREDWVNDTMMAIMQGAVSAIDCLGVGRFGFCPRGHNPSVIRLDGSNASIIVRQPDCVNS